MVWRVPALVALAAVAYGQPRLVDRPDLDCERCQPAYVRVGIETTVLLAAGVGWYWMGKSLNSPDWDFPGIEERMDGTAVRFDNNTITINNLVHPLDGGAYYLVGRTNRMGVLGASMLSVFASSTWEYVLEWREKVSINDLVMTPSGGIAAGEFLFQLGRYLNSAPDGGGWPHRVAAGTLGFPVALHRWMDGRSPASGPRDALGFSSRFFHRFVVAYDAATGPELDPVRGLLLEAELAMLSGYRQPRRFTRFFAAGEFTELALRSHFVDGGAADVELWIHAILVGVYSQSYARAPGGLSGTGARLGLGMSFEHTQRWLPLPQDRIGAVHLPGPSLRLRLVRGPLGLQLDADVHPDFAAIDALAWHDWVSDNGDRSVRTVLANNAYYFGFGVSTWGTLRVWYGPVELGGRLRYGTWDSVEDLDRFEEQVEDDVTLTDRVVEASTWVGWGRRPLQLRISLEHVSRRGAIESFVVERDDQRLGITAGLLF